MGIKPKLFPQHQIREAPPRGGNLGAACGWKEERSWKGTLGIGTASKDVLRHNPPRIIGNNNCRGNVGPGDAGDMGAWVEAGSWVALLLFHGTWTWL